MKLITGLNAHKKWLRLAKDISHTTNDIIIITENPTYIEDLLLEQQSVLLSTTVMTLAQFEQMILYQKHAFSRKLLQKSELVYMMRSCLLQLPLECFKVETVSYPLIDELISTLRTLHQNAITLDVNSSDELTRHKCHDLLLIDQWINDHKDPHHYWCLEEAVADLLTDLSLPSLFIDGDHYTTISQALLFQQLSTITETTLLISNDVLLSRYQGTLTSWPFDSDDYETLMTQHLFEQTPFKINQQATLIIGGHPFQEALKVATSIKQKLISEQAHYRDFMIVTTQEDYSYYFKRIFDEWQIAYHLNNQIPVSYDTCYQKIMTTLNTIDAHTFKEISASLLKLSLTPDYSTIIQSLDYDDAIEPAEFIEFLKAILNDHMETPVQHDAIDIVSLDHAVSAQAKHVYMVGMNESFFPKYLKDDIILNEADYASFSRQPLTLTEQMRLQESQIINAFLMPHLSLTLSYCTHDMSNSERLPSTLLTHLKACLNCIEPHIVLSPWKPILYLEGSQLPDDPINDHLMAYENINKPQRIDEHLRNQLGKGMSISRLETYNKCPFQYFVKYGLNVQPVIDDVMVNELGSLAHEIMEKCLDHPDRIEQVADDYIEAHLKEKLSDQPLNTFLINELIRNMHTNVALARDQLEQSSFDVYGKEIVVKGTLMDIPIKGYIDRVDTYNDMIRIVDYKSGHKDVDPALVAQGFNMQMLIYLELLAKQIGLQKGAFHYFSMHKEVIGLEASDQSVTLSDVYKKHKMTGYVIDEPTHSMILGNFDPNQTIGAKLTKAGNPSGSYLTQAMYDEIIDLLESHIDDLYHNIKDGLIPILPSKGVKQAMDKTVYPCDYCDYKSVCQYDVFYNDNRKIEEIKLGGDTDDEVQ